jgi:hypothetical protein
MARSSLVQNILPKSKVPFHGNEAAFRGQENIRGTTGILRIVKHTTHHWKVGVSEEEMRVQLDLADLHLRTGIDLN